MAFNNERELKGWYMDFLKRQGCSVYNIESHNNRGIPDLLVMREKLGDVLVELKNDKKAELKGMCYDIKYRPGQIAWHHEYLRSHDFRKCVVTLIALRDGFAVVPSTHVSLTVSVEWDMLVMRDVRPGIRTLKLVSEMPYSKESSRRGMFVDFVQHAFGYDWDFDTDVLWKELLDGMDIEEEHTTYEDMWRMWLAVVRYWHAVSSKHFL